jgi:KUP system potassium uptake protein
MSARTQASLWPAALASVGVVFGDIGTSPIYTVRECFRAPGVPPDPANVFGVISLIFWSLTVVMTLKYAVLLARADNQGEGGIFALWSLIFSIRERFGPRTLAVAGFLAMAGAALLYGDGIITPAISVLSAVEGLEILNPELHAWVVPLASGILIGLFLIQRHGTGRIGSFFGPVMVLWFGMLAVLGWMQVVRAPEIFQALSPLWALQFVWHHGWETLFVLGAVLLCVTGSEAMYADLGHFGRRAMQMAWGTLAYPALIMNYLGQGALLLREPSAVGHPYYKMVPEPLLIPAIVLTTAATVIASQAMISGVFSLTQQAVQLGVLPRLKILHTSDRIRGQIYMPMVNWMLMVACLGLVVTFRSSGGLAAAYGLSVTLEMLLTTALFYLVMRRLWGWSRRRSLPLIGLFLIFEIAFVASTLLKLADGAWIPLLTTVVLMLVMSTWRAGRALLGVRIREGLLPLDLLLKELADGRIPRVSGTGVFMSALSQDIPPVLVHHLKHNKALHKRVVLLSVQFSNDPRVFRADRSRAEELAPDFHRVVLRYGYTEEPRVMEDLCAALDIPEGQRMGMSFYQSRELLRISRKPGLVPWRKHLFAFISRTTRPAAGYFDLPPGQVIELGVQIEL